MTLPSLADTLTKNLSIPTLPSVVGRIRGMIEDPDVGIRDVGKSLAQDGPLAAKVLRIVNSSFYGLQQRCNSVEHAAAILGLRVLRNVVTQASVIQCFEHLEGGPLDLSKLWRHCALTARACAMLARRSRLPELQRADDVYISGLLHDIGKVVLLDSLKDEYVAIVEEALDTDRPLFYIEKCHLGLTHADISARVASVWGFPRTVVDAIQFHHGPREAIATRPIVSLVANANLLVERACSGNLAQAIGTFDAAVLTLLGIPASCVAEAAEYVQSQHETGELE